MPPLSIPGRHALRFAFAIPLALLPYACASTPHPRLEVAEVPIDAGLADGAGDVAPPPPPPQPLYVRLGGKDSVAALVDAFVDDLLVDKRLKAKLAHVAKGKKLEHLKGTLSDELCALAGGGCADPGKLLADDHGAMHVSSAQFDALMSDLRLALEEKQVGKDDAEELVSDVASLKDQVVTAR